MLRKSSLFYLLPRETFGESVNENAMEEKEKEREKKRQRENNI